MSDRWTERLSEYLDGDLNAADRAGFEQHLAGCAECAADLAALRRVAARARSLEAPSPDRDLWPGIQARLAGAPAKRPILRLPRAFHFTLSLPQAVAAGLALALLSGVSVWWVMEHPRTPRAGTGAGPVAVTRDSSGGGVTDPSGTLLGGATATPGPNSAAAASNGTARYAGYEAHYDQAIAELEQTLANNRTELDTSTVRIVEQNLAIIDRAIIQARRALEADPASPYLHQHLALQMKLKLDLLRRAAAYTGGQG